MEKFMENAHLDEYEAWRFWKILFGNLITNLKQTDLPENFRAAKGWMDG